MRSFNVSMRTKAYTSNFKVPGRALILAITKQDAYDLFGGIKYRGVGSFSSGDRVIAEKTVKGDKTNYKTSFSLSQKPNSMYLAFFGYGATRGGLYY